MIFLGKILFALSALALLAIALRTLRERRVSPILRAMAISCGIYLLIAGLLLICGGLGTPH